MKNYAQRPHGKYPHMSLLILALIFSGCETTMSPRAADVAPSELPAVPRFSTQIGLDFVLIPHFEFTVADPANKGTRLTVETSPFYAARHVVTKGMFARFLQETKTTYHVRPELSEYADQTTLVLDLPYQSDAQWYALPGYFQQAPTSQHIMKHVCFAEAEAFANWLSRLERRPFRLPSEAQAQVIARGGVAHGDDGYWWMATEPSSADCWLSEHARLQVAPAESHVPGLYAMTPQGIQTEFETFWTSDVYQKSFLPERRLDPEGPRSDDLSRRTIRNIMLDYRAGVREKEIFASIFLITAVIKDDHRPSDVEAIIPATPVAVQDHPRLEIPLGDDVHLNMRQIPAGRFVMGRSRSIRAWTNEWPETMAMMQSYWLGETEVTQAQFRMVTGINPSRVQGDTLPVHSLTMGEVQAFCELVTRQERAAGRLGAEEEYRLPTEAEWERAARAGSSSRWSCGDDPVLLKRYAWFDLIGQDGPKPVATRWPNAWGFYDMEGNVIERCCEHQHTYPGEEIITNWLPRIRSSPSWTDYYTARGGSFNMGAIGCEPTIRRSLTTDSRVSHVGFRLCRGPALPYVSRADRIKPGPMPLIVLDHDDIHAKPSYRAIMQAKGIVLPPLPSKP